MYDFFCLHILILNKVIVCLLHYFSKHKSRLFFVNNYLYNYLFKFWHINVIVLSNSETSKT